MRTGVSPRRIATGNVKLSVPGSAVRLRIATGIVKLLVPSLAVRLRIATGIVELLVPPLALRLRIATGIICPRQTNSNAAPTSPTAPRHSLERR